MSTTKDRATHCFCCRPGCSRDTPCYACTEGLRQQDDPHFFERDHGGFLPTPDPPKEEQRAPLLSDVEIHDTFMYGSLISDSEHGFKSGAGYARNFYEAKITSGELMVPKTCSLSNVSMLLSAPPWYKYHCCGRKYADAIEVGEFCKCGAKIIA